MSILCFTPRDEDRPKRSTFIKSFTAGRQGMSAKRKSEQVRECAEIAAQISSSMNLVKADEEHEALGEKSDARNPPFSPRRTRGRPVIDKRIQPLPDLDGGLALGSLVGSSVSSSGAEPDSKGYENSRLAEPIFSYPRVSGPTIQTSSSSSSQSIASSAEFAQTWRSHSLDSSESVHSQARASTTIPQRIANGFRTITHARPRRWDSAPSLPSGSSKSDFDNDDVASQRRASLFSRRASVVGSRETDSERRRSMDETNSRSWLRFGWIRRTAARAPLRVQRSPRQDEAALLEDSYVGFLTTDMTSPQSARQKRSLLSM